MPHNKFLLPALHAGALVLALAAALVWPRPGQAALLVPLGNGGMAASLAWAEAEQAEYLAIDPTRNRVITRVPSNSSLMRALRRGIVPVTARDVGCYSSASRSSQPWKN